MIGSQRGGGCAAGNWTVLVVGVEDALGIHAVRGLLDAGYGVRVGDLGGFLQQEPTGAESIDCRDATRLREAVSPATARAGVLLPHDGSRVKVTSCPIGPRSSRAKETRMAYSSGEAALTRVVPHFTREERAARGKAAREVPRSAHAQVEFPAGRDPVGLLEEQAVSRVPELVPIRYGRMLTSPFAFFRGGALIMAADLARTPVSGLRVQLCGDAHLSNFGMFGSPERTLVFDINDFDETAPGPWEWDVKRLVTSFAVAGRGIGFSEKERRAVVLETVRSYREAMRVFAGMRNLDLWYSHLPVEQAFHELSRGIDPKRLKKAEADIATARTKDSMHAFERLTRIVDGERRIISDPPLIVPIDELAPAEMERDAIVGEMHDLIRSYRRTLETDRRHLLEQFRFVDLARKIVGVGSVGTRAWIALFLGIDSEDPLFLQLKEVQPSVLERFVGKSVYANCGQRVVAGQRLMQATSDIFLGWERVGAGLDGHERDFFVRQLKDWKGSFAIEAAVPAGAAAYGKICGRTLARAHARSGDRVAIASYLGGSDAFDQAVAAFAETYADQNERDYQALQDAVNEGRVTAQKGL